MGSVASGVDVYLYWLPFPPYINVYMLQEMSPGSDSVVDNLPVERFASLNPPAASSIPTFASSKHKNHPVVLVQKDYAHDIHVKVRKFLAQSSGMPKLSAR